MKVKPLRQGSVPAGYKQTEVGVIPEDWLLQRVDSFATTVASGRSHVNSEFGDYPVFGSTGIIGRSTNSDYSGRAILIARVGANAGKLSVVDGEYGVTDNTIMVKLASSVHMDYCWRQLEARRLNSMVFGSGQPLITGTQIKSLNISLPPTKAEQEAIAEALSDADALIESLEQLLTKKRHLKQGAMQQLLTGKSRLSGFTGEWETSTFGDIFNITAGGDVDLNKTIFHQDQTHCYPIYSNALTDFGLYGYCSYADHQAGSITVTARGTLGYANFRDHAFTAIGRVLVLHPKQESAGRFFAEFINQRVKFAIESTGVPQLTAPQISTYSLPTPHLAEQTAITAILSDMDAEIAALEAKLTKTRQLKQGMMQELLTGKIRLI